MSTPERHGRGARKEGNALHVGNESWPCDLNMAMKVGWHYSLLMVKEHNHLSHAYDQSSFADGDAASFILVMIGAPNRMDK